MCQYVFECLLSQVLVRFNHHNISKTSYPSISIHIDSDPFTLSWMQRLGVTRMCFLSRKLQCRQLHQLPRRLAAPMILHHSQVTVQITKIQQCCNLPLREAALLCGIGVYPSDARLSGSLVTKAKHRVREAQIGGKGKASSS